MEGNSPMTPKQRVKQLIRNYEQHLEETGKPPTAPDGFLYMDLCDLVHQYEKGMADDALLERKLAQIEGAQ
jgi:hypothetical protein